MRKRYEGKKRKIPNGKTKSIYMKQSLIDAVEQYAETNERTFSWAAAKLLSTHPDIKRIAK